jgi:hypothetical protein
MSYLNTHVRIYIFFNDYNSTGRNTPNVYIVRISNGFGFEYYLS